MTAVADCLSLMAHLGVRSPPRPSLPHTLSWEESAARRRAQRQRVRLLRYPWLALSRAERRQARRDLVRQRYFMARDKKVADQRRAAVCSSLRKCREIISSASSSSWGASPTPFYVGCGGERVPLLRASKRRGPEPSSSLSASSALASTIYFTPLQGPRSSRRVCLSVPLSATVQALIDAITFAEGPLPSGALSFAGGSLTCLSRTLDTYGLYDGCSVGFAPYLGRGGMPPPSRSRRLAVTGVGDAALAAGLFGAPTSPPAVGGAGGVEDAVCAADLIGAIHCESTARALAGLRILKAFEGAPFEGCVDQSFKSFEDFNGLILHRVTYSDGDVEDLPFAAVMEGHYKYLAACPGSTGDSTTQPPFLDSQSPPPPPVLPTFAAPQPPAVDVSIPVPGAFADWPFFVSIDSEFCEGRVMERVALAIGGHRWRVDLCSPRPGCGPFWYSTAELQKYLLGAKKLVPGSSLPARIIPTCFPIRLAHPPPIDGQTWTARSPLVGLTVHVRCAHTMADHVALKDQQRAQGLRVRAGKPRVHAATIEAVAVAEGSPFLCWGRLNDDNGLLVYFTCMQTLSEAAYAYDYPEASGRRRRILDGATRPPAQPPALGEGHFPDTSFGNALFMRGLESFRAKAPDDPILFYGNGFHLSRRKVPRRVLPIYREALLFVVSLLERDPNDEGLWKLILMFDALILAPEGPSESFRDAIKRRIGLLRSGSWDPLLDEELMRRPAQGRPSGPSLSSVDDPALVNALRAEKALAARRSRSGASAALSAPANPRAAEPGDLLRAFQKLNPQVGDPCSTSDGSPASARRPLLPPTEAAPPPVNFTVEEVLRRVRSSNKNSAGGLSGSDYQSLSSWLHCDDELTGKLVKLMNRIAAGDVPHCIVGLLTAGRGVVIPKDEVGGLRPIVVGHILLRFVGSLALSKEASPIRDFFKPVQFGVGVQGGCELVAASISSFLALHPGSVDIGCDAQNAFNSWDRTKLWGPLRRNFPSLFAFGRLLYGAPATILFAEEGVEGASSVLNSVGSRQGCSWGSFCYCLAIQGLLTTLISEYPDLLIVAYADDVHIVGPPGRAVPAYHRWRQLYEQELQGNLRPDKSVCFAPDVDVQSLTEAGLDIQSPLCPLGMPVVQDGTRILGAPIGSVQFQADFARCRVAEICSDLNTINLMPSLQMQNCLAAGSTVHRINHLLRNIPGGEIPLFGPVAAIYDNAILDVPRRLAGRSSIPSLAMTLASLPGRLGGLGYTTWSQTADAAYLASYVHISHVFPSLFPRLSGAYPSVLSLASAADAAARSRPALFAFNALRRLEARAPSVTETVRRDFNLPIKQLQHALSSALAEATHRGVLESLSALDLPQNPRSLALFRSNCSDSTTFSLIASDDSNTFSNRAFEVAVRRRLLLPLTTLSRSEFRRCPTCAATSSDMYRSQQHERIAVVDVFGDHALHCRLGSGLRTRLWHDPIVRECLALARMAGTSCAPEVSGHMLFSDKRPDLVIYNGIGCRNQLTDVVTCDPCRKDICMRAATRAGAAAEEAALGKERSWTAQAEAQGETFYPLAIEAGGAVNERFREFLVTLASSSSPSPPERALFLGYALQRIRAVSLKGVCAIILGRPTSPGAPGGLHTRGSLPLAQPKSRPLGKPFAPRGSPARGLAWRSPPRGGSPPWGADLPPPVPARVPAPQFPQQSPSPSPSPAPLFEYTQRPPASPTR